MLIVKRSLLSKRSARLHITRCLPQPTSSYQMYKEQKLKANHNGMIVPEDIRLLLSNVQRTKVESK
jgi:hypothetical protein